MKIILSCNQHLKYKIEKAEIGKLILLIMSFFLKKLSLNNIEIIVDIGNFKIAINAFGKGGILKILAKSDEKIYLFI